MSSLNEPCILNYTSNQTVDMTQRKKGRGMGWGGKGEQLEKTHI
jgi:hypothetical protein